MWKGRVIFGLLFTVMGFINTLFHTSLNLIAAIFMFLLAANAFNLAQKDYYEEKENDRRDDT